MKAFILALTLFTASLSQAQGLSQKDQHKICDLAAKATPALYYDQGTKTHGQSLNEFVGEVKKLVDNGEVKPHIGSIYISIFYWTDLQVSKFRPLFSVDETIRAVSSLCAMDPARVAGL